MGQGGGSWIETVVGKTVVDPFLIDNVVEGPLTMDYREYTILHHWLSLPKVFAGSEGQERPSREGKFQVRVRCEKNRNWVSL